MSVAEPQERLTEKEWKHRLNKHVVNEQFVEEVHFEFLYKPHTVSAFLVFIFAIGYFLLVADVEKHSMSDNLRAGLIGCSIFILILGLLVFPSGPFIRPHPLLWRFAFGVGVVYQMFMILLLFQTKADAREMLTHFFDYLNKPLAQKSYATHCEFEWSNIRDNVFDIFFVSHFLGWVFKALMLRDWWLCWIISISWEIIEIIFIFMLPNFAECWWDQWILDVALTNGLGIFVGIKICKYFEMRDYTWSSVTDIPSLWGKTKRLFLQFTPATWTKVHWETTKTVNRFIGLHIVVIGLQLAELNAFLLKQLLWVPSSCPLNVWRLLIWWLVGVPALRQIYVYMHDPKCKRMGNHAFLVLTMLATEALLIVKLGQGEFNEAMPEHIKRNVIIGAVVYAVFALGVMMRIRSKQQKQKQVAKTD